MTLLSREVRRTVALTPELVASFARITGDENPIHLDERRAHAQGFEAPIVHGLLLGSLSAALVGSELPGPGAVIQKFEISFRRPCLVGETITLEMAVLEEHASVQTCVLTLRILDHAGALLAQGRVQVGYV